MEKQIFLLRSIPIFAFLERDVMETIASRLIERKLVSGESLFQIHDESLSSFILEHGSIRIHDGDYTFAELAPPEIFGEYALLDQKPRSASATASTESIVWEFLREDFDEIVANQPGVKDGLVRSLLSQLRYRNDLEEEMASKNEEIRKQKEEIEKQRDEIKAQRDLRDRFFSIISHDLRGPISSFQGLSSIIRMYLKKGKLDQIEGLIEDVDVASNNLSNLLDNLLNWASQQRSQIPYNPERLKVKELVGSLCDNLGSSAVAKGIDLRAKIDDNLHLFGDRNTVATILRNLTNNALKFTAEGGQITITATESIDSTVISIQDNGVGMPEEKLKTLFRLQDKKSTYGTSGEKGVGLGLQLVEEFVKLNKGSIEVLSEEGKGTLFKVFLPRRN